MTAQVRLSPERSSHATRAGEGHVRKPGPAKVAGTTRTPAVADLVARARDGDQQARDALVERYAPLIWPICRRHRLGHADVGDVAQGVWLQMVNHLDEIRDPAALPGWLATTTGPECSRALRAARGPYQAEYQTVSDPDAATPEQELLLSERRAALREAFRDLRPCCQQLIALLIQDPPGPYAQISATLGIPRPLPGQAPPAPGHHGADQR
jgi:RNA polymerase sigma factor (sigma-70 family)